MATGLLEINQEIFSSKLFDEPVFRQCAQWTKCHFDTVTFRRNGSLDEVSFDKVSHFFQIFMEMCTYNLLVLIKLNCKYTIKFQCILKMSISLFICK